MDARPTAPQVQVDNIPPELRDLARWVGWRYERRGPKWEKIPVCCITGARADVTDPATWASFEEAVGYCRGMRLDGVGFVFTIEAPYAGIDLDDCIDPTTGVVEPWAKQIIRELGSYAEISPSGTGIKIFVKGKLPPGTRRRKGKIEIYSNERYFTVTGDHLAGTPLEIGDRQPELDCLHAHMFASKEREGQPCRRPITSLTDEEVVAAAMKARNGPKFSRLMAGDTTGYGSTSEADLALCAILAFWVGPEPRRIEALFGRSELAKRGKWSKREDYREQTIRAAIEGGREFVHVEAQPVLIRGVRSNQNNRSIQDNQDQAGNKHTSPGGLEFLNMEREKEGPTSHDEGNGGREEWHEDNLSHSHWTICGLVIP